ncbi:hypothetical protein [Streptomyces sp. NBC_00989]|uniref:hypothetical protein n=1 Tax=Streptomyces sp. NBC_00989 TaxID=2903705 RepID=UPI0038694BB0|nr:hypothetical protein OG714_54805 [Streptomyces sp. NBC_00989]
MITVEELLGQLDRVAPSAPGYDQAGLDRLMAWMAADDPADSLTEADAGTGTFNRPVNSKILVVGSRQAGSVDFITKVSEFSAPTEFQVPGRDSVITGFFGRITLSEDLMLYTFATPDSVDPQAWDILGKDAVGAVVLADPRRMVDCFDALNYLDDAGMPYVLAIRGSAEHCPWDIPRIREALQLAGDTPVLFWEPDRTLSAAAALIAVVETALERRRSDDGDVPLDEELTALTLLTQLELHLQ